jgi:hypothetical protein
VVLAGAALGVAYTLSPLTVLCLALLIAVTRWAGKHLSGRERDWFFAIMILAVVSRLLIIAGLFLFADPARPYATFFGDEEIFKSRPIWLRNVGLGVPISTADFIYAFDETGMSGHLYVLAYLQALVGDAPYGVHVFNMTVYVAGVLVLHRLVRPAYGQLAALGGLAVLLFLPSLLSWSISALKEPIYTLVAVGELACVMFVVRAPRLWQKGLAVASIAVLALAMQSLRKGTLLVATIGTVVGVAAGLTIRRPRLALAAAFVIPLALVAALSVSRVQDRLLTIARDSVRYHTGHVLTPGNSYKIIDHRYYDNWSAIRRMEGREAAVFVSRAVFSYFAEPLPQNMESKVLWAYLPEHLAWWVLIALVPFGVVAGLRRDALLTSVLIAHACAVIMMVALTSGNIGTLIRHRGLALIYLVWPAALGAVQAAGWLTRTSTADSGGTNLHGDS